MALDLAVIGLITLFAYAGYHSGAVRQLSHGIGLAAAWLLAKPTAALLGPAVAARMGWPVTPATSGLTVVMFPAILLVATLLARLILNMLEPGEERGPLDQGLGAPVGLVKGGAVVFVALCLAATLEEPLARFHFDLGAKTQGSWMMAFARKHNPFAHEYPRALDALKKLSDAHSDPEAKKELLKDRSMKSLLKDKSLKAALEDETIRKALRSEDFAALAGNPLIRKLLENPNVVGKLNKL